MQNDSISEEQILRLAQDEGYLQAGFCSPDLPETDRRRFLDFLKEGRHAGMEWLRSSLRLRLDPDSIFPGVQSLLVLASYYRDLRSEELLRESSSKIARYAHGRDYHRYLRKKGKKLLKKIQELDPSLQGRIVVDSAPVLEKVYARKAGLGWQGKHTNLIHPKWGSWFFISILFLNKNFSRNTSSKGSAELPDLCRDCNLCVEACPTNALEPYKLDAGKCLSYITIEAEGEDAQAFAEKREGWIFGCDICQEVCPYNRNRKSRHLTVQDEAFELREPVRDFLRNAGKSLQEPYEIDWEMLLSGSPLRRAGKEGLKNNLRRAPSRAGQFLKSEKEK